MIKLHQWRKGGLQRLQLQRQTHLLSNRLRIHAEEPSEEPPETLRRPLKMLLAPRLCLARGDAFAPGKRLRGEAASSRMLGTNMLTVHTKI